jgi:hypothetical protein
MSRHENILETIGNTPMVKLHKLAPSGMNVNFSSKTAIGYKESLVSTSIKPTFNQKIQKNTVTTTVTSSQRSHYEYT